MDVRWEQLPGEWKFTAAQLRSRTGLVGELWSELNISEKPKGLSNIKYIKNEHVHILYYLLVVLII